MSNPKTVVYTMSTGGVGDNVTGSGTFLNCHVHGKVYNVGVDCGISQGKFEKRNEKYPLNGENITAFVITHAHMDHMGALAMLKDFKGKIYGTKEALLLGYELIYDGVYQNVRKAAESKGFSMENYYYIINELEEMKKKNIDSDERKDLEDIIMEIEQAALYNYDDVERIRKCFCYVKPLERFIIANGVYGRIVPNSHQLGAISAEIYVGEVYEEDSVNISFSGDIGPNDSLLYKNFPYEPNEYIQYAWMESTHGIEERPQSVFKAYLELKNRVFKAIKRKGTLIIGTFSLDRSAKILYLLNRMIDETNVCVPIYWDTPLGYRELLHYQDFYHGGKGFWFLNLGKNPFDDNELIVCNNKQDHLNALMDDGPKVIITASAFGEGGRIHDYFDKYIQDENADFLFAGWLSPDCTSNTLFTANRGDLIEIEVNHEIRHYVKFCKTTQILGLTSHGYLPEFLDYIDRFPKLKGLVLNHGDRQAKEKLADRLNEIYDSRFEIAIPELYDDASGDSSFYKLDANSMTAIPSIEGYKIFEHVMTNI